MNIWITLAIVAGLLMFVGIAVSNTVTADEISGPSCSGGCPSGGCTAESNCGLSTCGVVAGTGSCGCGN